MFEEQVGRTPDAVAVVFQNERMAYAELNRRADTTAEHLRALGIGPDVPVGICLERSLEMVISVLAVLKAGGAYLPLDPAYPKERLKLMIENSRSPLLLTQRKLEESFKSEISNVKLLCVEDLLEPTHANGSRTKDADDSSTQSSDLAYIIHTSGSTGAPKGVAIEHRQAVNFICWAQQAFTREELAGVLFSTSLCFDLSVFELFVTLSTGGKVIMARNAIELLDLPAKNEVTLINTVPSAATELLRLNAIPPSVRVINLAGEPLKTTLVDRLYALGTVKKVHDLYGPSETTTYSTYALRQAGAPATVGRPIASTQIHLLDEMRQTVPTGEIGEIYIGGAGVARGYLHRPDLTAERFVPDPFSAETNARLYRTGDLARWRTDGNLEFLGRIDHQIKIRGYRVELGEVEIALAQHPAVRECVVIAREDTPDEKRLVAYVVHGSDNGVGSVEFRGFLQTRLPDYMVPSAFVQLEALPLTPNGKVDRKRLPVPDQSRPELTENFVAPGTPTEQTIAEVWREVLGVDRVGLRDDFFELGGDSLLAVRLFAQIEARLHVKLPIVTMFQSPTVEQIARAIDQQATKSPHSGLLPIQSEGDRPPLFLVHGAGGDVLWGYANLARHTDHKQPIYGVQAEGDEKFSTLEAMAAHYVEQVRAFQPVGPYYLGGYCFGGNVAQEMARQLEGQGEKVALLALLDCAASNCGYESFDWRRPTFVWDFTRNVMHWLEDYFHLKPAERRSLVFRKLRTLPRKLWGRLAGRRSHANFDLEEFIDVTHVSERETRLWNNHLSLLARHVSKPQSGHLTLFRTRSHPLISSFEEDFGWGKLAAHVTVKNIPGSHEGIFMEPHVSSLASELEQSLSASRQLCLSPRLV